MIYTHYVLLFQLCGLVLLVAMIGAIVLTLRERPSARRQDVTLQHARTPADTIQLMTLGLGASVNELGGFVRPKKGYGAVVTHGPGRAPEQHQTDHHHGT